VNGDSPIEARVQAGDPVVPELEVELLGRRDRIWQRIQESHRLEQAPRVRLRTRRAFLSVIAAASIVSLSLFFAQLPTSERARESASVQLTRYAQISELKSKIPGLKSGQYYYQRVVTTISCTFPLTRNVKVDYLVDDVSTTWTRPGARSLVESTLLTSRSSNTGWSTHRDRRLWLDAGKPPNPCLGGDSAIALSEQSNGSHTISFSGVGSKRLVVRPRTSYVASSDVLALFNNESAIPRMLSQGDINPDGSVNSTPGECPVANTSGYVPTRGEVCQPTSQLKIVIQLLQLPDLSRTLGGVLCRVLATLPGVVQIGSDIHILGQAGAAFEDPKAGLVVVVSKRDGGLLQTLRLPSTESRTVSSTLLKTARLGRTSFGTIAIVNKIGAQPT
jgi:hypothetical protein